MGEAPKNGWWRWIVPWVPLLLGGYGAFRVVQSDVQHLQAQLDAKADRAVVDAQYRAILDRLADIQQDVRELRGRQR
jgi:hypothetical protein